MPVPNRSYAAFFLVLIIFIAFITLGMPGGLLDIANPKIRATFHIGPDTFSLVFLTSLIGYFFSSFFAGQLVMRVGIGLLLAASCFVAAIGLIGDALSPGWAWFVMIGLLGGVSSGIIDAGLNTYVATYHGPRLMFWLHASFGLGVTGGTWLMSLILDADRSWRLAYVIVGVLTAGVALCFLATRTWWKRPQAAQAASSQKQTHTPIRSTLRIPLIWVGIALFFMYTGVEIATGRWASSLFIESRHIKAATAGLWVSIYWGLFTVGRVVAGFIERWLAPLVLLRLSMVGAVIAALLLVLNPVSWSGGLALGIMGLALAPVFPMLIAITPARVGAAHVPNAVGFQISAAAIGGTVIPGLIGILAKQSLEIMPVLLLVSNVVILILHEILLRTARQTGGDTPPLETGVIAAQGDR